MYQLETRFARIMRYFVSCLIPSASWQPGPQPSAAHDRCDPVRTSPDKVLPLPTILLLEKPWSQMSSLLPHRYNHAFISIVHRVQPSHCSSACIHFFQLAHSHFMHAIIHYLSELGSDPALSKSAALGHRLTSFIGSPPSLSAI